MTTQAVGPAATPSAAPPSDDHAERSGSEQQAPIEVLNPATGEIVGSVPSLSGDAVRALAARAREAQAGWDAAGFKVRARVFRRAQRWLHANSSRVSELIRSETGKTYEDAQLELAVAARAFAFWATNSRKHLADRRVRSSSPLTLGKRIVVRYRPVGVVGVIGPWNYPLVNGFGDCIPALMAGNAVIHKPSEVTPLTAGLVAEMLESCGLPDDVFLVATGDGDTGAAMIDAVDYVMFTGSTATGRKVMERAARRLTPVSLELGGKDPMIVLREANIERAANNALYSSMNNSGQICISIERVYVEDPVYDEFVDKVAEKASALRQGPPQGPGSVELGAMTTARQLKLVEAHVRDAVDKGARVLRGGRPGSGPGLFYEPTVLVDVDHTMRCMTEETFGPLLPIMKVANADEAIRLANDSAYGLQAAVFSRDTRRGEEVGRRLDAGACCINDAQVNFMAFEAPMGGWKNSGIGSRHGADGIRKYCRTQTMLTNRFALDKDPYMFPYTAWRSEASARFMGFLYRGWRRAGYERGPD
jgi:acyl-CoA reductase-like NAD-dependent aldehyde dehydrogenase